MNDTNREQMILATCLKEKKKVIPEPLSRGLMLEHGWQSQIASRKREEGNEKQLDVGVMESDPHIMSLAY